MQYVRRRRADGSIERVPDEGNVPAEAERGATAPTGTSDANVEAPAPEPRRTTRRRTAASRGTRSRRA